ncbi:hypothetical protein D3C85_1797580 [compost metagenome]
MHRAGDSVSQLRVFRRLVVEHPVRFHVTQLPPFGAGNRRQRTNLVQHLSVNRFRRQTHGRTPEVFPVGKARMRANRHAIF